MTTKTMTAVMMRSQTARVIKTRAHYTHPIPTPFDPSSPQSSSLRSGNCCESADQHNDSRSPSGLWFISLTSASARTFTHPWTPCRTIVCPTVVEIVDKGKHIPFSGRMSIWYSYFIQKRFDLFNARLPHALAVPMLARTQAVTTLTPGTSIGPSIQPIHLDASLAAIIWYWGPRPNEIWTGRLPGCSRALHS